LQGAVYYEGSGVDGVAEFFNVYNCTFDQNDVGIPFFTDDLAVCMYIKNPRDLMIDLCSFVNHNYDQAGFVESEQPALYSYYPDGYFDSAHGPLIRLIYDSGV
jgi:hypothetical protein